jgi:hypothetical protein
LGLRGIRPRKFDERLDLKSLMLAIIIVDQAEDSAVRNKTQWARQGKRRIGAYGLLQFAGN